MAVVHCKEITGRDGSDDRLANKRYTRKFQVLCDSPTDGAAIVLAHDEIPEIGETWESVNSAGGVTDIDLDVFVVDRKASSDSKDLYHEWIVTVSYAGRGDPLLEPPDVWISSSRYQVAIQKDVNNKFVRNSAGDPFGDGILRDASRFQVVIEQNVLTYDILEVAGFIDSVNEQLAFFNSNPPGLDPGTCKLSSMNAHAIWLEDLSEVHYWRRTAAIEVNLDGWGAKILDSGFRRKHPGGWLGPIFADTRGGAGGKISAPVLLDGEGGLLPMSGADPVYIEFQLYPFRDWTYLNLEWVH